MIEGIRKKMGHLILIVLGILCFVVFMKIRHYADLQKVIHRLEADSRVAEVLVTESLLDEVTGRFRTTIKFLEYNADQEPLLPKYFTFHGNQIQFQALVVRFEDNLVKAGHPFKGKSIYLFLKAFVLDGASTEVFVITPTQEIPDGYKVKGAAEKWQAELWEFFWSYALDPTKRQTVGVKNAQLEAPGSVFVPGTIYTIRIEHDGGLRIDATPIPRILKGEKIH